MNVKITQTGVRHFEVRTDRLGLVGHIFDTRDRPFRLVWAGDTWMKLSYDETTAVLAATTQQVTLLNITRRMTR